jgi:hypothetical protein
MKLRPFAWVILVINAYFLIMFFKDFDTNGDPTVNGASFMFLIVWLAILNSFLYVLFRITAKRRGFEKPNLKSQLKEIDDLKREGLISIEEYDKRRARLIEGI